MATTFQLYVNGAPADSAVAGMIGSLEVEENANMPGAIRLTLPVDRTSSGELSSIGDSAFKPLTNLAVMASAGTSLPECIFDGVVLSQKLHIESGVVNSSVKVWGQDYSWMMNLEEKAKEWVNVTDSVVAATLFGSYGIAPSPDNSTDDSAAHTESGHSLMQRATDAQFLRDLARRNGKVFRVAGSNAPGARIGYFAVPRLDGTVTATLNLHDADKWNITSLDIDWDVTRPTAVNAKQKSLTDTSASGVSGDVTASGLTSLASRDLATFAGNAMTVMLTSTVDDAGELTMRSKAVLRESGWFVKCEAEADVSRLGVIPRVGQLYAIDGIGSLHSGNYYAWSIRHSITANSHKAYLTLVRNSIGNEPTSGGFSL